MSIFLPTLPHRRRSRRRARTLRARLLVGGVFVLLSAYIVWSPQWPSGRQPPQPVAAAYLRVEPATAVDAAADPDSGSEHLDADRYVADR